MNNILLKEMQLMFKEKANLIYLIIMPLAFIIIFGTIFNHAEDSTITVNVTDNDHSAASKTFIAQMKKIKGFDVKLNHKDVDKQISQIKDGKLNSLIVIPKGFNDQLASGQNKAKISFYQDAAASNETASIEAILKNLSNQYRENQIVGALAKDGKTDEQIKSIMNSPVTIDSVKENSHNVDMMSQMVPGYTVMFAFYIFISVIKRFFTEKESGMISRLQSTGMNPLSYLLGMWIPHFLTIMIQCIVLIGFGHFVYGMHIGSFIGIFLLIVSLAVCGSSLGVALSFIVKNENQGIGMTQFIALGGAMLGGLWFPSNMLPKFAQAIGKFTPQYWAQQGFLDVIVRDIPVTGLWKSFAALIAFGIIGIIIALTRYKAFLRSAIE
ncbi:ABC transporter permease [Terrilactibacillus laevilacticus]|uniref:ABC transporter permease n=1 Tax=Terrilactibacillus laevilacticus TaxID=1380157 RepID=A0ABW5PLT7_9BACI|nr:ABC transporter permease [Terrilactibacillus laevilacticus]